MSYAICYFMYILCEHFRSKMKIHVNINVRNIILYSRLVYHIVSSISKFYWLVEARNRLYLKFYIYPCTILIDENQ